MTFSLLEKHLSVSRMSPMTSATRVSAAPWSWTVKSTPRGASWAARVRPWATWRPLTPAPTPGRCCSRCPARSSGTAAWPSKSTFRAAERRRLDGRHQPSSGVVVPSGPVLSPGPVLSTLTGLNPTLQNVVVSSCSSTWWCLPSGAGRVPAAAVLQPAHAGTLLVKHLQRTLFQFCLFQMSVNAAPSWFLNYLEQQKAFQVCVVWRSLQRCVHATKTRGHVPQKTLFLILQLISF